MWLGRIDKQQTNVGFFDGGKSANGRKFFNTNFAFAGFTETSGVEEFNGLAFEFKFKAIDIACGSLFGAGDGLLFLAEAIEETGFTNVWTADEGDLDGGFGFFFRVSFVGVLIGI